MKLLSKITLKNLFLNKKRTIVSIIGILLSTSLMVGIGLLFSSFQKLMIREVSSYAGSYHVLYKDVDASKLKLINDKSVSYAYEEALGFSKIDSKNKYKPYLYINAVNSNYFNELELVEGRFAQNDNEIVLSTHLLTNGGVDYKIGDEITLAYGKRYILDTELTSKNGFEEDESLEIIGSKTYKVVGKVSRSNFESYDSAGYYAFTLNKNPHKVNVYITFDNPKKIMKKASSLATTLEITDNYIDYNDELLAIYGQSKYYNYQTTMIEMMAIMLSLVAVGSIIVIYNSYAISFMERKRSLGLLSSIGATHKELGFTCLFEALVTGILGITLGVIASFIGIGILLKVVNYLLSGILEYKLELVVNPIFILISIAFMVLVILISSLIPAFKASRIMPIEAIFLNDDIKIKAKKVKTHRFISKIFGVEGELALKNIKRNKKKYRITIISLFISIVLFISFSAYSNYTLNTVSQVTSDTSYDIVVDSYKESSNESNSLITSLINNDDVTNYTRFRMAYIDILKENSYTDKYLNIKRKQISHLSEEEFKNTFLDNKYITALLIGIDNDSYQKYLKELGLKKEKAIVVNSYSTYIYENNNRKLEKVNILSQIKHLNYCKFDNVDLNNVTDTNIKEACKQEENNIYVTDKNYSYLDLLDSYEELKIIVNEDTFKKLYENYNSNYEDINYEDMAYTVLIQANKFTNLDKIGENINKLPTASYVNITQENQHTKNLILVIKILMYGFISLITLIGVTSVFNTIYTSITLRRREFAILRSIGLDKKGFNKILFFESLFFGLKSLIYALPVSLGIVYLIHLSNSNVTTTEVLIPYKAIFIAIILVFVIILITMWYSTSQIKKDNIIDTIRDENI